MYEYDPMSEEEAQRARFELLDDGEYDALVIRSEPKMSASGNSMADMTLTVYNAEGKGFDVRDFLIWTSKMMWKLKHFCESAKLEQEYLDKKFRPELAQDRYVRVKIRRRTGNPIPADKLNGKPPGSVYPDKNEIEDYLPRPEGSTLPAEKVAEADPFNDDVPF